jgi:predicted nucleic acid-binding protein
MSNILVDTDILIEVLRAQDPAILEAWQTLSGSGDAVLYSAITVAELWHGLRPREEASVTRLLSALTCLHVDAEIARCAGKYLKRFRSSHGTELGDALIAASAAISGCALWTRNRKHYPMKDIQLV